MRSPKKYRKKFYGRRIFDASIKMRLANAISLIVRIICAPAALLGVRFAIRQINSALMLR